MRRLAQLGILLAGLLVSSGALADHLEVRRPATIKSAPRSDASVRARVSSGDFVALLREGRQTNGYYRVESAQTAGWIYRTLVRRRPGPAPPSAPEDDDDLGDGTDDTGSSVDPGPTISGYSRRDWPHWSTRNCRNVRNAVLVEEATGPVQFETNRECRVERGTWLDPYSGMELYDPDDIQIDHLVPLRNAHLSGGWSWDRETRRQYANDMSHPEHLIATRGALNMSKGALGPEDWMPPDQSYWCEYARGWEAVKNRWNLSMTVRERDAIDNALATCGN